MRRSYVFSLLVLTAVLFSSALVASAQLEQMRGSVKLAAADGTQTPVVNATVDVYRTDIKSAYHTKTDKKGEWIFAGLPFVGTYTVAVSAPGASPATKANVKARADQSVDIVLTPGDGKKLTEAEAYAAAKSDTSANNSSSSGSSAEDKAKAAEMAKKNAEIAKENEKTSNANKVINDAFISGNKALQAKNYDEAIKQYDTGLAADPDHPGIPSLLTNKSVALRTRGVDRYNAGIQSKDDAAKTASLNGAKEDFTAAVESATKAVDLIKKQPVGADAEAQKSHTTNLYFALSARAEAMRLFLPKVDPTKADDAVIAYQEYIAAEPDAAKKSKAQMDLAQMLLDSGAADKSAAEFEKIVAERPDDPDANLGLGLALFSTGDKAKYQEAANYLQKFVDKAPDTHKFKNDAKAVLAELKAESVTPEKTPNKPPAKKRP
ncbi:MAG TPA: carboxypeptidase regulatory-like domain-containing protein [Pyrinomonadaceae bacterium]|jgi:tetratricopeptide (TPR) repeat protein|nr:carboxypeptidase regulatory-like domain-containing protein [Pyrinomonadaceae bacterium]